MTALILAILVSIAPAVAAPAEHAARDDSTAQAAVVSMPVSRAGRELDPASRGTHRVGVSGLSAPSLPPPLIGGRATWYPASGMIAAAGPALREYLGRHWRGALLEVHYRGKALVVRVTDWCACHGGGGRLLDLSDDAFAQLAPLSKGVINVSIPRVVHHHVHRIYGKLPELPATDTAH